MFAKVRRRNDRPGYWFVDLHWKGDRFRRYHYDDNVPLIHPALAQEIANRINADIRRKGKYFDPRQWFVVPGHEFQLATYAEKWIDKQRHYAPSYEPDVRRYVTARIAPHFGTTDIREIRKGELKEFQDDLLEDYAPKTVQNIMGILHKIFADAYDDEDILRIPPFPKLEVPEPELKWLTQETIYAIIDQIPPHDQPIFLFGYFYALRPGEARALQRDCIDYDQKLVTIRRTFSGSHLRDYTKTKRIRNLPLEPEPAAILKRIPVISGIVFRTTFGRPYRKQRLGELWRKATAAAGAPFVPLKNGMRHSRAMHLLEHERWDLEYVQTLLGHTRVEMTRRYSRASAEGLRIRFADVGDGPGTIKSPLTD